MIFVKCACTKFQRHIVATCRYCALPLAKPIRSNASPALFHNYSLRESNEEPRFMTCEGYLSGYSGSPSRTNNFIALRTNSCRTLDFPIKPPAHSSIYSNTSESYVANSSTTMILQCHNTTWLENFHVGAMQSAPILPLQILPTLSVASPPCN